MLSAISVISSQVANMGVREVTKNKQIQTNDIATLMGISNLNT